MKAPFPWFGGKSRVAHVVWHRFGNVPNYVEPFAGALAVLLARPTSSHVETVNDLDCYLANFWRAVAADPEAVAQAADWPVNEADLHARHLWLVNQDEFRERMKTEPDYFDSKIAGWWVWGICQWIGSGWCSHPEWRPRAGAGRIGRGVNRTERKRPLLAGHSGGNGVHKSSLWPQIPGRVVGVHNKIPNLGDHGRGVHRQKPQLSGDGSGVGRGVLSENVSLYEWMFALRDRLRRVRVCCGDWTRVLGPSCTEKIGLTGIFLDPPYDMRVVRDQKSGRDGAAPTDKLYAHHDSDLSAKVRLWAIENGDNPMLRIAVCGYEEEHTFPPSWEKISWKANGGMGNQSAGQGRNNAERERIWFSPHCLKQPSLFGESLAPQALDLSL